jgi:hypothetical protein
VAELEDKEEGRLGSHVTTCDAGSVSVPCSLLTPPPPPPPPSPSFLSSLQPGTSAASPSPLMSDVGSVFSAGMGLHTKGGPVKWEAQQGK